MTGNICRSLVVLGSTGSIGESTLEVVRQFSHNLRVVGLAAGNNTQRLEQQIEEFKPDFILEIHVERLMTELD